MPGDPSHTAVRTPAHEGFSWGPLDGQIAEVRHCSFSGWHPREDPRTRACLPQEGPWEGPTRRGLPVKTLRSREQTPLSPATEQVGGSAGERQARPPFLLYRSSTRDLDRPAEAPDPVPRAAPGGT